MGRLAVLTVPCLLVSMDIGVLFCALPFISGDLRPSGAQQLWIIDTYSFMLAGMLITMGAVGDWIGRRRVLLIGALMSGQQHGSKSAVVSRRRKQRVEGPVRYGESAGLTKISVSRRCNYTPAGKTPEPARPCVGML